MLGFAIWFLISFVAVVVACFLPKWLYWITPRAYSVHDVLAQQYGARKAKTIVLVGAALLALLFAIFRYGSDAGW